MVINPSFCGISESSSIILMNRSQWKGFTEDEISTTSLSADYLLNKDWVTVEAGDFLWLRAFCPQACRNTGNSDFRYLLYKDVNRHPKI